MNSIPANTQRAADTEAVTKPAGVLVAGGKSVRMGRDKALLTVGEQCLGERQLGVLSSVCGQCAVAARVRPDWLPGNAQFLPDRLTGAGPAAALLESFAWARDQRVSHVVLLAVDLPAVTEAFLRSLLRQCESGRGNVPRGDSFYEPLCAIYPVEAEPQAVAFVTGQQGRCLQDFVGLLVAAGVMNVHPVSADEAPNLANINTPADWAAWRERG